MNVAVPFAKHSPVFGQCALLQTVLSWYRSSISRVASVFGPAGSRFFIQGGNLRLRCGIVSVRFCGENPLFEAGRRSVLPFSGPRNLNSRLV